MPIYEYYCAKCDAEFESMCPVSRMDEPVPCATCGEVGHRLLSNFSFKSNSFTAPKLKPVKRKPFRSHNQGSSPKPTQDASSEPDVSR